MGLADSFSGYNWKNSYTLFLLTVAYIFGEIAHYLIGSLSKEMARDIGYGDYACYNKPGTNSTVKCSALKSNQSCQAAADPLTDEHVCEYLHNGQGFDYLVLAGTIFIAVFTVAGVVMGVLADRIHRPRMLAFCVLLFSASGALTGLATQYWHLVVLRLGIAVGEAAMRPAGGSLIPEIFPVEARGQANGIFSWGIYFGYGLTFTLGNYLAPADILGYGWRSAFVIGCSPAVIIAVLIFFLEEPRNIKRHQATLATKSYGIIIASKTDCDSMEIVRSESKDSIDTPQDEAAVTATTQESTKTVDTSAKGYVVSVFWAMVQPEMLLLFLAATIRQAGGLTWALNPQQYLNEYYPDYNPGLWLTMCSIFGGSFGVFAGGFLSDLAVKKMGLHSRLWILAASQICAVPLSIGVLSVEPPYMFVCLLFYYFFAETWFAVLFTVIVEIVPTNVRSVVIAMFLFLMNNVGGQIPLLITPIKKASSLRTALLAIWPGCIGLCAIVFFLASVPLWIKHMRRADKQTLQET